MIVSWEERSRLSDFQQEIEASLCGRADLASGSDRLQNPSRGRLSNGGGAVAQLILASTKDRSLVMQFVHRAVWSGPLVLLRLKGAASFAAFLAAYGWSGHSWRMFALLFLAPDLSMLAYLANSRVGAVGYNLVHTTLGPIFLGAVGLLTRIPLLPWIAVIWMAHIEFDRMLGYGLKYATGFKDTHLRFGRVTL
jgi:hypothetical protein